MENISGAKGEGGKALVGANLEFANGLGQGYKISPCVNIEAHSSFTIADIKDSGQITHIWMTLDSNQVKKLNIDVYYDGSKDPAISCPLSLFFAIPNGTRQYFDSSMITINPGFGLSSWWPMPFRKGIKIVITNNNETSAVLYFQIDYELRKVEDDECYLHTFVSTSAPLKEKENHVILPTLKGKGCYVGTIMDFETDFITWWGEGEIKFFLGCYNRVWRELRGRDYVVTGCAVTIGLTISALIGLYSNHQETFAFFFLNLVLSIIAIVGFRVGFKRTFVDIANYGMGDNRDRTLIVGAGMAAQMILREIRNAAHDPNNPSNTILPICLVDDDVSKFHTKVMGVDVVGTTKDIAEICAQYKIDLILFAIPSCDEADRKRIMELCSKSGCRIKMVPYLSQLFLSDENPELMSQVKDFKIEDLLGRDPITFDKAKIREFISGKICMVTGGGGSIGSELVRQIAKYHPKQIIIVDIYENNAYDIQQELYIEYEDRLNLVTLIASVRDRDKMEQIFSEYKPEVVFHAAAHKHVPLMETSPAEAVKNNIFGTWNMVTLAEKYHTKKFVMISTDKAVNPTNVMGATKRCCEMIVQYMSQKGSHTEFVTTRFGNVLGSNGSVIPLFRRQIESGKPVTVTHPDIIRYFMTIPEAVSLVLEAAAIAKGGEIFVLDMGDPVKITTLAENLIRMYDQLSSAQFLY